MSIIYRPINNKELKLLKAELNYWLSSEEIISILEFYNFLVGKGKWTEIFITNKDTKEIFQKYNISPYSIGLGFGEIKNEQVMIGVAGLNLLKNSKKKIYVNSEAEQLFLYQKDILCRSILSINEKLEKSVKALVVNNQGDILGIGRLMFSSEEIFEKRNYDAIGLKNLIDLGWYIRKGK